jgi:prolyl-tRNA synthetase
LFQKEADHVEGFAKEMAVVTHSKLEMKDGKLTPANPLEEPLVVRPTSETIIAEAFSKWVGSYRDLPVMINQWANVVRWEMRTRMFLRTTEFLWQEGHTAHSTEKEAVDETLTMIECYRKLAEDFMAMPVIVGKKTERDKFPGAVDTYAIMGMMPDGRALQAGTSHYLGQKFSKSANIAFQNKENKPEFAYTTSWGVSTRLVGGLIMTHGDDEGLRVPPRLAPYQVVIVPIARKDEDKEKVYAYGEKLEAELKKSFPFGDKIRVKFDKRDKSPVDKRWEWLRKGAPIVVEVGPKDIEKDSVAVSYRNKMNEKKQFIDFNEFTSSIKESLEGIQTEMFNNAKKLLEENIVEIEDWDTLVKYFEKKNLFLGDQKENKTPGFVRVKWSGENEEELETKLKEFQAAIHCIPNNQTGKTGKCILTGKDADMDILVARSY